MKEWLVKMKRDWTTDNSVLCVWTRDVLGLCFICVTVFIVVYLLFIMSKKRGGHVCAVKNCKNRRYNCDKSFFRFPSDPNRARIWILKCHREDLLENLNSVDKSSRLCEDHFEPRMFTNHLRNRLNKNAVPTLFPSLEGSSKDFSDHAYSQPMLVTSNINILQDMVLCPTDVSENNPGDTEPSLDMSDTNIVHITVPSRYPEDSNCFAEFSNSPQFPEEACEDSNSQTYNEIITNSFGQPVVEEEEYHCRTCLSVITKSTSIWVTETLILDKNVRDVIIFLVPEMESKLKDEEVVCTSCLEVLKSTMKFIVKCLEVDAILTKEKEEMQGVEGSIDIKEEEIDEEHDYCGKVISVGDIISTEDVADINEDVTLLEQAVGEVNERDSVELHYENMSYVENNVEIQYDMAEEWLPNKEEELSEQTVSFQEYESYDEDANVEEIETLSCSTCMESFTTKEDYEVHLQVHPPHICETCGETFTKRESLRAHRLTHNDPNSYICEVCGQGFKDYETLQCHLKNHSDDVMCTCEKCSKTFKNKRLLDIHMKYVHDKVYDTQCTICGILTKNEVSLKTHMRLVHFKEKPFECNICHKKFGRSDYLHNHKLRHTAQPRIVKPQPEKRKVRTKTRMRYKIQDRGEPVPCKFCGQWYKDIVRLKRHLETHLKRYPCQFCPLTFPRNILCKRHEEIHRGGTVNFSRCNVCWKKFKTKEALDEHVKCHNNPQHFCDLCGKTFNRKFLLSHHKLMEHSNIPDKEQPEEIIYDSLLEVGGLSTELDG